MDRIWHFLAGRSIELADRTEAAIRAGVEFLASFPAIGRPCGQDGREWPLQDIQYRIGYHVRGDRVLISTVRHTREAA